MADYTLKSIFIYKRLYVNRESHFLAPFGHGGKFTQPLVDIFVHLSTLTGKFFPTATLAKSRNGPQNVSIVNPHVHMLGDDAAAVAYVKVTQYMDK